VVARARLTGVPTLSPGNKLVISFQVVLRVALNGQSVISGRQSFTSLAMESSPTLRSVVATINSLFASASLYLCDVQARHSDGQLSVGAATASNPLGPFTDVGAPLVHESNMGHIGE
jgi:hypothetical protein